MAERVLAEKVAIVTGAASGIGLAIANRFAQEGACVLISDVNEAAAQEAAAALRQQALNAHAVLADMTREEDIRQMVQMAEQLGGVHILVNNAGMQHVDALEDFPVDRFRLLVDLMLVGPFIATKYVFPVMKRQQFGRILNMASVNGLIGFAGKAAYNSAKHGLIGLTKVAALEGATHGITVNALCPGYVDTPLVRNQLSDLAKSRGVPLARVLEEVIYPLVPQRRLLETSEIADYALFLATHQARSVTGQAVVMDGGYLAQ